MLLVPIPRPILPTRPNTHPTSIQPPRPSRIAPAHGTSNGNLAQLPVPAEGPRDHDRGEPKHQRQRDIQDLVVGAGRSVAGLLLGRPRLPLQRDGGAVVPGGGAAVGGEGRDAEGDVGGFVAWVGEQRAAVQVPLVETPGRWGGLGGEGFFFFLACVGGFVVGRRVGGWGGGVGVEAEDFEGGVLVGEEGCVPGY